MALSAQHIQELEKMLRVQHEKLTGVLTSLKEGDPASTVTRTTDNADAGTDAIESRELVEYEALERETSILLSRVEDALGRIKNGTYGVTDEGEEIPYERLLIDPTVTTTVR